MKIRQKSASDAAHAMHPVAPLTTERSIQKCRPIKLLWTEMGTAIAPAKSPDNEICGLRGGILQVFAYRMNSVREIVGVSRFPMRNCD
jgi:hypothetical protein